MTSNQPYTTAAGQAREITERLAGPWREGMKKFADQATMIPTMPPVDLNQSVEQYFQFVQKTVDLNRDLATSWAELVNTLTGATREQAESFGRIVKDQADTLAGMAAQQAETTRRSPMNGPNKPNRPSRSGLGGPGRRNVNGSIRTARRLGKPTRV